MPSDKLESSPGGSWKSSPPCSLSASHEKSPVSLSGHEPGEMLPYNLPLPYSCAQAHTCPREDCRKLRPVTSSPKQDDCRLLSAQAGHRDEHWGNTVSPKHPLNSHTLSTKPSLHNGSPATLSYGNSYAGKTRCRTNQPSCFKRNGV